MLGFELTVGKEKWLQLKRLVFAPNVLVVVNHFCHSSVVPHTPHTVYTNPLMLI